MNLDIKRILRSIETEDGAIILGDSKVIEKYGKKFIIRQVNWYYKWEKFSYWIGVFLNSIRICIDNLNLPETKDEIKSFVDNVRMALTNISIKKHSLKALINLCKIQDLDVKFMKKNFDISDWCEIFLWIYLYNIAGLKKNLKDVYKVLTKVRSS